MITKRSAGSVVGIWAMGTAMGTVMGTVMGQATDTAMVGTVVGTVVGTLAGLCITATVIILVGSLTVVGRKSYGKPLTNANNYNYFILVYTLLLCTSKCPKNLNKQCLITFVFTYL